MVISKKNLNSINNFFLFLKMSTTIPYNPPRITTQNKELTKTYFPIRGYKLSKEEAAKDQLHFDDDSSDFVYEKKLWRFKYPEEFVNSDSNEKYIIFQYGRVTVNKSINGETTIHASFVPRNDYFDSIVYLANLQVPDDNRKYLIDTFPGHTFEVWFRDANGQIVVPDSFVIFLKLVY